LNWQVDSAGTNGFHTGEPPHSMSQKVAALNGLDISGQRSRKFISEDFFRYDKIYAMANDVLYDMKRIGGPTFDDSKAELFLDQLLPGRNMDVPDPWSGPEEGYHDVFKLIDQAAEAIVHSYIVQ
jgi:protein-tyrosine phosphatase